jgi:hypothetical protein
MVAGLVTGLTTTLTPRKIGSKGPLEKNYLVSIFLSMQTTPAAGEKAVFNPREERGPSRDKNYGFKIDLSLDSGTDRELELLKRLADKNGFFLRKKPTKK